MIPGIVRTQKCGSYWAGACCKSHKLSANGIAMKTFTIWLAVSAITLMAVPVNAQYVYVNNNLSNGNLVTAYGVNADGTLMPLNSQFSTGGNDGLCFDIGSIVVIL